MNALKISQKFLFVLTLVLAPALAVANEAPAAAAAAPAKPMGNAEAGKAKAEAVCAACHGAAGNKPLPGHPRLAGQGARYIEKQLHDFKSGKRANAVMMGMASPLSDQEIRDIAAYFAAQKSGTEAANPEQVKIGEKVWRGGNLESGVLACTGCHGPSGRGNYLAGFPALRGQRADYVENQLKAFRASARGDIGATAVRENDPEGIMRGVAKHLSDAEIQGLAQFVSGLYQ